MRTLRAIFRFFWVRHRTCWRKVTHKNERDAEREVRRLGGGVHAYRCPFCRRWHVGHSGFKR